LIPLKFRLPDPQLSLSAEMSISPSWVKAGDLFHQFLSPDQKIQEERR
jgi:hypothetical protein